jgi:cytochrome P450
VRSNGLAWVFYLLAQHPEVERRLRAEVLSVIGSGPSNITAELLSKMPYLSAVCKVCDVAPVVAG